MYYTSKGTVTALPAVTTTKLGTAVQQIHLEQDNGRMIYPSLLGTKIEIANDILPGDKIEIKFHISGSKGQYNNVIIDDLKRV